VATDKRIRELCARAVAAKDPNELERAILELQIALHVHSEKLKLMVRKYPLDQDLLSNSKKEKAA
jgi:hypothetical protein